MYILNTIKMYLSINFVRGNRSKFLRNIFLSLSLKIVFILSNSADPDKMPP